MPGEMLMHPKPSVVEFRRMHRDGTLSEKPEPGLLPFSSMENKGNIREPKGLPFGPRDRRNRMIEGIRKKKKKKRQDIHLWKSHQQLSGLSRETKLQIGYVQHLSFCSLLSLRVFFSLRRPTSKINRMNLPPSHLHHQLLKQRKSHERHV